MKLLLAASLTCTLSACVSSPQRLPVGLSICNAVARGSGFAVTATVQNRSDRPISSLGLAVSFYRNFRYSSYTAGARLATELDPGQKRDVTFEIAGPPGSQTGQAIHCLVTHIGYMDGTSADIPASQ
jgi:hypothetical protein